jgi:hypothetical protein
MFACKLSIYISVKTIGPRFVWTDCIICCSVLTYMYEKVTTFFPAWGKELGSKYMNKEMCGYLTNIKRIQPFFFELLLLNM